MCTAYRTPASAARSSRVWEPPFLLVPVVELARLREMLAHPLQLVRERSDSLERLGLLEVAQDLVAVAHGRDIAQRRVEEHLEVVLLAAAGHRRQHLVEVQVAKGRRLVRLVDVDAARLLVEEDAVESQPITPERDASALRARTSPRRHPLEGVGRGRGDHSAT